MASGAPTDAHVLGVLLGDHLGAAGPAGRGPTDALQGSRCQPHFCRHVPNPGGLDEDNAHSQCMWEQPCSPGSRVVGPFSTGGLVRRRRLTVPLPSAWQHTDTDRAGAEVAALA